MKRQKNKDNKITTTIGKSKKKQINSGLKNSLNLQDKPSVKIFIFWIFIITLLTTISYYQAFNNQLTTWDDNHYIEENPYLQDLSSENIKELFSTDTYYMGNYHPLAMISLSIDYAIAGDDGQGGFNPFIFHFINILLHIFVSIAVFFLAYFLFNNLNIAIIAGLLFGVHTLHVESVAWVSERKDVLYALFFIISLISYVRYIDTKKLQFYILALFLFVLSLLSKGQAVSLAITLFAIDFLRQRNLLDIKLLLEKIPFLALAVYFGLIAINAQEGSGAIVSEEAYTFGQRIIIAAYAFVTYVHQLILPINLSAINPYPDIIHKTLPSYFSLYLIPALTIVFLFFYFIKKNIKIAFTIGFFIINIILLLQFIPVGSAMHADRYAYIPSIGFFLLIAILVVKLIENKPELKKTAFIVLGLYIVMLGTLTYFRTFAWENSLTLWTDTVQKSPKSVVAWNNLGSYNEKEAKILTDNNEHELSLKHRLAAIDYFTNAINGKPDYFSAFYNRGVSRFELSKNRGDTILLKLSISDFTNAIKFNQTSADAYHYRANAKAELLYFTNALLDMDIAISMDNTNYLFYINRGIIKGKMNDFNEALKDFNIAESMNNTSEVLYSNKGLAKAGLKLYNEAIVDYNKAISIKEGFITGYYNRAIAYERLQKYDEAISDLTFVINNSPNMNSAYNYRAYCYRKQGKIKEACNDYQELANRGDLLAAEQVKILCN